ncbi:MBL fold metallo-hydrolase [Acidovorax sp. Leaf160]|uniref:MBL fold metallo-hydrolase n=1 Tax=Acidovorax sp. Leaf160 TaxID=1736280 RepID=UPI0006F9C4DE|nr:MBL fold metallo-hydrolase [Acidovorax sp. Leaf160]KQR49994.1 MBL fold metallo-hydrolase [Acidovorax sp. Leaf160]
MLRFRNLASGSTGNATLIEGGSDGLGGGGPRRRLLMDCGLGIRILEGKLAAAGITPAQLDAVFITHEHSDHIGCVQKLVLRHRVPVWMSQGTHEALGAPDFDGLLRIARDGEAIDLGAFEARPFTVPHDAREPLHLRCSDGATHVGLLTDLGHASEHVLEQLRDCHALLLESNHDPDMLQASAYPAFLKRRISGRFGHLPNQVSADILRTVRHTGLRRVVAAHLSAQNNHPDLARAALADALGWPLEAIDVAHPREGTGWIDVG